MSDMRIARIALVVFAGAAVFLAIVLVATHGTGSEGTRREPVQATALTGTSVVPVAPARVP